MVLIITLLHRFPSSTYQNLSCHSFTSTFLTIKMSTPAQTNAHNNGPIDHNDLNEWKDRFNDVLARPSEHVNSKSPESSQPWQNSFFGCFSPVSLCAITCCVPCVTFGKTHHRLRKNGNLQGYEPINTSCLLFWGSTCFGLHWIPLALQRANLREKYNLQGSCLVDLATACCCGCCDLIQQDKEAEYREAHTSAPAEGYKANEGMTVPA
ncbi:PLAC8 family-domain-containing protein [Fusarium sp. MPI-SDFR-AT-0072]|nr:PLAC8 family-domain-containing protein [Fusarium sp. MPI-SDFR-AT-0072]